MAECVIGILLDMSPARRRLILHTSGRCFYGTRNWGIRIWSQTRNSTVQPFRPEKNDSYSRWFCQHFSALLFMSSYNHKKGFKCSPCPRRTDQLVGTLLGSPFLLESTSHFFFFIFEKRKRRDHKPLLVVYGRAYGIR